MKKIISVMLCAILSITMYCPAFAGSELSVNIDGKKVDSGANRPVMKDGRVLAPVSAVFKAAGATVAWEPDAKRVTIQKDGKRIEMVIGSRIINVSDSSGEKQIESDVAPEIINGATYVPVGVVAQSLGAAVRWDTVTKTAYITTATNDSETPISSGGVKFNATINGNELGFTDDEKTLEIRIGQPKTQGKSVYGYIWKEYDVGYGGYALVGESSGNIVAFYSNYKDVTICGIKPGMTSAQLKAALGTQLKDETTSVIVSDEGKLTIYRNALDNYSVLAVMAQKTGSFTTPSTISDSNFNETAAKQLLDIINSHRANEDLEAFKLDEKVSAVSQAHTDSMVARNYCSSSGTDGNTPFIRMNDAGIVGYSMAAESVGRGALDAIEIYAFWMNQKHDAANINAENYNYVGIGTQAGETHKMYFTIDFIER